MKLENEFTVPAAVEQVWPVLLDIARVGNCLPGAVVEPSGEDGVYRGTMKIKLGPVTTLYEGTARIQDVDRDAHTASISVTAREANGQGTASAVITNRLVPADGHTRVVAETDLAITGRQAQFGRGIMQDVASRLLGQFAARLEEEIVAGEPAADPPAPVTPGGHVEQAGSAHAGPRPEPEALDLGNVLLASPRARIASAGIAVLALALIALLLGRRRTPRGFRADLSYRR